MTPPWVQGPDGTFVPVWDPVTEVYPGGPHPGEVAALYAREAEAQTEARADADRQAASAAARTRSVNMLLLLR